MNKVSYGVVTILSKNFFYEVRINDELLEYEGKQIPNISCYTIENPGFITVTWQSISYTIDITTGKIVSTTNLLMLESKSKHDLASKFFDCFLILFMILLGLFLFYSFAVIFLMICVKYLYIPIF